MHLIKVQKDKTKAMEQTHIKNFIQQNIHKIKKTKH